MQRRAFLRSTGPVGAIGGVAVLMAATTVPAGVGVVNIANRVMTHAERIKRLAGAVMILAGLGQRYLSLVVY